MSLFYRTICCLSLLVSLTVGAEKLVHFDRYTVENGLSSNMINDIDQDTCGHLWMATDYGVTRYDGYSFKRYVNNECPSLLRNEIYHVCSFADGSVFLCGHQGVMLRYDPFTDTFRDVAPLEFERSYYKSVEGFTLSRKQEPLAFTSGGFYRYDKDSMRFDEHLDVFEKWKDHYVVSLYEDFKGRYWVGSFNSLKIVSSSGEMIKQVDLSQDDAKPMFAARITAPDDHHVLVTFFSDVIYSFVMDQEGNLSNPTIVRLPFSSVNRVLCDRKGHFWYTTDGDGLWYSEDYPSSLTRFQKVVPTDGRAKELQKLYDIHEARNGDLWVATHSSGLWRFRPNQLQSFVPSADIRFPMQMASSFSEDSEGNIYVSCDGGGLSKISPDYASIEYFDERNGLTSKNVVCHTKDSAGHLWLATWGGGLLEFDPQNERFRQESFPGLATHLSCFTYVNAMPSGELWVSTGGDGLYVRDREGRWRHLLLQFDETEFDMWPFKTEEGKNHTKWIATSRSLWRLEGDEQRPLMDDFSKSKGHNPIQLNDLLVLPAGDVLVATDRSVLHFSEDGNVCDTLSFLPKTTYSSIIRDHQGMIYVSSGEGILKVDRENHKYIKCAYDFRKNGEKYFRSHAAFQSASGDLLWGTKDGFILQNGAVSVQKNGTECFQIVDVRLGDLSLSDMSEYLVRNADCAVRSVTVPHDMSNLRFAVDYVDYSGQEVRLQYRLTGFSDKWQSVPENREVQFSYLPSGSYRLEVRACGVAEEQTLSLDLEVLTPWWKQWWFWLLAVCSLIALVVAFFYVRMRRMQAQKRLLEEKVEERTRELQHVLSDKDRVLSVIAHDLKNPMFAIVGALEGWMRKEPTMENGEKRSQIAHILSSSQTLQTEMGRLLEWARAKNEKIDFNPSDVDVRSSLDNVVSLLSTLLEKKNVRLTVSGELEHCAWADPRMLSTIFRNFINNALKFTPDGGMINVEITEKDSKIGVVIADNGVGMSPAQLKALQTKGYTQSTLGTDNEKGTGLGFRICKDYVERNGGTLQIASEEGKGTTITLAFPASQKRVENSTPALTNPDLLQSIDRGVLEGNTVVVVDDDALICQNIASILQEYMEVVTASNGAEALELVKLHQADLVLSDVEMPVMNGIEFSRELARNEETNAIPFLFLSAKNEESDRLLGLLSGAVDYIAKPFSASELLMKVNNILRLRQMQQIRLMQQHYFSETSKPEEKTAEQPKEEKINPFVEKVMTVLSEHFSESDFSIETLASCVNVSQSTLTRRLKSVVNKTPIELLNEYRLTRALERLKVEGREENIAEIAYEVGYSDPAYFTRKFKEFYGYLPSAVKS